MCHLSFLQSGSAEQGTTWGGVKMTEFNFCIISLNDVLFDIIFNVIT